MVIVCNMNIFSSNSDSGYLPGQASLCPARSLMVIRLADVELLLLPCSWPSGGCGVTGSTGKEHCL